MLEDCSSSASCCRPAGQRACGEDGAGVAPYDPMGRQGNDNASTTVQSGMHPLVSAGPLESVRVVTAAPASAAGGAVGLYNFLRVEGASALAAAARSQHGSLLTRRDVLGNAAIAPLTTAAKQASAPDHASPAAARCMLVS